MNSAAGEKWPALKATGRGRVLGAGIYIDNCPRTLNIGSIGLNAVIDGEYS